MHAHEGGLHRELAAQGPDVLRTHGAHHWELRCAEGQLATGVAQGRAAEAAACTTHKSTNTAQAHRDALLHSHDKHTSCTHYSAPSAFVKNLLSSHTKPCTQPLSWHGLPLLCGCALFCIPAAAFCGFARPTPLSCSPNKASIGLTTAGTHCSRPGPVLTQTGSARGEHPHCGCDPLPFGSQRRRVLRRWRCRRAPLPHPVDQQGWAQHLGGVMNTAKGGERCVCVGGGRVSGTGEVQKSSLKQWRKLTEWDRSVV